jgi:hypothetical protein
MVSHPFCLRFSGLQRKIPVIAAVIDRPVEYSPAGSFGEPQEVAT